MQQKKVQEKSARQKSVRVFFRKIVGAGAFFVLSGSDDTGGLMRPCCLIC